MATYWYFDDDNNSFTGTFDNDYVYGYGGNDMLNGGYGDDILDGGNGNDTLHGNTGNDTLTGGAGDDVLYGDTGNDKMIGGDGNDSYYVDSLGDVVTDTAGGGDAVYATIDYTLGTGLEYLFLQGTASDGKGNILNNTITGNGNENWLYGEGGDDTLFGEGGNDYLFGGTGIDYLYGGAGNDQLNGGNGNDVIHGNAGSDTLYGEGGNDTLIGGDGDTLYGGAGNDQYHVNHNNDLAIEWTWAYNATSGKYVYRDEGGTDTANVEIDDYTLPTFIENLTLDIGGAVTGSGNGLANIITGNGQNNTLYGYDGNDTIHGDIGDDTLYGGLGNDTLYGDAGNDTLVGDAGNDTMLGGAGNDGYNVVSLLDKVYETTIPNGIVDAGGVDSVLSSVDFTLPKYVENLYLNEYAKKGTGNSLDNILWGDGEDNILDGGAGNDNMRGLAGDDTYYVDSSLDTITENLTQGTDRVFSTASFTLANNVENLTLAGAANINGTGNGDRNLLTGNTGSNTLSGGGGDDILNGGVGNDTMYGGTGDDAFYMNAAGDQVIEYLGEGDHDIIYSMISLTLGFNIEDLVLDGAAAINGTGNGLDNYMRGNAAKNILTGDAGDDTLDGLGGNDTLYGGAGNDHYTVEAVGDKVFETDVHGVDMGGTDRVSSYISYTLGAFVEDLSLWGNANINGTGNALDNELLGNAGNNILDGGPGGNDSLQGWSGDDTYIVGTGDTVFENADYGVDTVQTDISYTLPDDIENLALTGSASINGTGNVLDNILTGNSGSNILTGGVGNDTLNGMVGNDILLGGTGDDTYYMADTIDNIIENLGEGTDGVYFTSTVAGSGYTLGLNIENLSLNGNANTRGTGNDLDNILIGNSGSNILTGGIGNDTLNGGAGIDTLIGGIGSDAYWVDNAADVVTENAGEGNDILYTTVTYTLAAGSSIENLTLKGNAAIGATGNELGNTIYGNAKNNTLNGQAGNDWLHGKGGNDTLNGGTGDDALFGEDNNDTLNGGDGADSLAGGTGNDILTGGIGNDNFWFDSALNAATNKDTITDFTHGSDTITLNNDIFLNVGDDGDPLSANFFRASKTGTAADSNDYILYNTTSGALFFDADGNGAGVAVQFATLTNKPQNLVASDFLVSA
jgi:Ca2+-binding RTX toxin-like protein